MKGVPPWLAAGVHVGHFVFESGDHGDTWLDLDRLLVEPEPMRRIVVGLATALEPHRPDTVLGPETGGARLAQRVAEALGTRFIPVTRQVVRDGPPVYAIPDELRGSVRGARASVVDDAINAGFASGACVDQVRVLGGTVIAVAAAILRQSARLPLELRFGCGIEALHEVPFHTWPGAECPLCRSGEPVTRRDSA